ncbi:MAG: hypothetical protein JXB47_21515 [Anaerolineae bacterium]|nr:hypothetical protein [Anaerolineae bacterium]
MSYSKAFGRAAWLAIVLFLISGMIISAQAQDEGAPTPTSEGFGDVLDAPVDEGSGEAIPAGEALPVETQTGGFGDAEAVTAPDEGQGDTPGDMQPMEATPEPTAPPDDGQGGFGFPTTTGNELPQTGMPDMLGLGVGLVALMGVGSVSLLSIVFITRRERKRKPRQRAKSKTGPKSN